MSSDSKENSSKIIWDSKASSKSKESVKKTTNNVKPVNDSSGQTQKLNESINSQKLVINTEELEENITAEESNESVSSTDSNWWVNDNPRKPKPEPKEDEREVLKRKIANKEIDGYIIHYSPQRKYTPMPSVHRLYYSHLRSNVSEVSSTLAHIPIDNNKTNKELSEEVKEKPIKTPKTVIPKKIATDVDTEINLIANGVPEWMNKPKDKLHKKDRVKAGLECVEKMRKFYIYDKIKIIDSFTENNEFSRNWFTLRNSEFQKLFYCGTKNNRKASSFRPFTMILVDQYSRKVMYIKKHWKCFCCGLLSADIECPPGEAIGHMQQNRFLFNKTVEFVITDPKTKKKRFIVRRMADSTIRHEFDILNNSLETIGSITKRFEKIDLNGVVKEDHYVRVGVPQVIAAQDKALLICAAILITVFYLKRFRTIEFK